MIYFFALLLFVFGLSVISIYFWMIVVRPLQILFLARKYKLNYKWLEIKRIKEYWLMYEIRKNLITDKKKKLLIYDTSFDKVNPKIYRRRTVVVFNKKTIELSEFLFGYASIRKIEKYIIKS